MKGRGLSDQQIQDFLSPSLVQIPSPIGSLKDLDIATEILKEARVSKKRVVVFGDYDVDGTTSTALLTRVLKEWNFNVGYFVPHRVREGYGVTLKAAQALLEKEPDAKVVVTCDCGVASFEGIEFLKSKNISVIVTDHHEVPPKRVSADAVLNPKQKDCSYPDKKLAGVGVAFLLLIGLRRALDLKEFSLANYLDLVAIGTVCDVAELSGANRVFVKLGLEKLSTTEKMGLQEMLQRLELDRKAVKARDLGFLIGPRLNAVGRVGEPDIGVKTLLSEDAYEVSNLVSILEKHNTERRAMQDVQLKHATQLAQKQFLKNPSLKTLVLADASFHLGIVGLLAAKLAEQFQRPTCVLTELIDEHALADFEPTTSVLWKGSLRTPTGYHLADALQEIRKNHPQLLKSGGGHALAAGVAIEQENLEVFKDAFEIAIANQTQKAIEVAAEAELDNLEGITKLISLMEPCGNGNPTPLFLVKNFELERVQVMKEIHMKLHGRLKAEAWSLLHFKSPYVKMFSNLSSDLASRTLVSIDLLGELSENEWNGNKRIELQLKDLLEVRVSGKRIEIRKSSDEVSQSQSL
ncbi:MAG: single-stranded-DNA-specific exonuclease RecJ [Deltaproteobacteria bacterium]|nr:single-stranded-DNA-specific exonuclease RecJ [Deltaproteobacteria bacterium]